jgi:succinylglutamate desuccinylase
MIDLEIIDNIPEEFLEVKSTQIKKVFKTPTLIHLKGQRKPALFVSILLHGNEYSGLEIMQNILEKYKTTDGYKLPRDIWLFVGNVDAAELGMRRIDGQLDFNRAWPGTPHSDEEIAKLIKKVVDTITKKPLFASVDLHNNTGKNPHYGCISVVDEKNKYLCSLFNHIAMVFKTPKGVSTMAFDGICPAITLECSTPGNIPAKDKAYELVDALLHMDHFPQKEVLKQDLQLLKNTAVLKINKDVVFEFSNNLEQKTGVDLVVIDEFEYHNFSTLKKGEVFAYSTLTKPLIALSSDSKDITDQLIDNENGKISLKKEMIPAMISMDKKIVLQDCLCYLLEDY